MKPNVKKTVFIFLTVVVILSSMAAVTFALGIPFPGGILPGRQVNIAAVQAPSPSPTPTWTIQDKIAEATALLQGVTLKVGTKDISYKETRITVSASNGVIMSSKSFKEPEKEIALAVLNTQTGEIKSVVIDKKGADLIAPQGWGIAILDRPNGIRWNGRNTAYRIDWPENYVVIANVYPSDHKVTVAQKNKGKTVYVTKQTIDYDVYTPYSPDIHSQDLVRAGSDYTAGVVAQAFADLRRKGVMSRAVGSTLIADVFASRSYFFQRIPLLEQTDQTEFFLSPQNTVERVQVIIGANQDRAFEHTCNSSSACGWLQFTDNASVKNGKKYPGTYSAIVRDYPAAALIKDFTAGARDHVNSMEAAILLYDENLKGLISSNGSGVLDDPKLEEYLAASYNGKPQHAYQALHAAILAGIGDWIDGLSAAKGGLKSETQGYMMKLRYLQQNNLL